MTTPYCTLADIIAAYGETVVVRLADRDGDAVADAGVIAMAVEAAAAEIDGWLARRYAVPLLAPPPRVKQAAVVLTWFNLHQGNGLPDGDPVRIDYGNQLKWLQAAAKGEADLPGASPAAASGGAAFTGPPRVFSRGALRGF